MRRTQMTAKTTKATESLHESASQPVETMAAFNGTAIGVVSKACEAYMNGFAEVNAAAMNFMSARLRRDAELGRELGECKDWNAVTNSQQDWSRKAVEDYVAETRKLMELNSRLMANSWNSVRTASNEVMEQATKV
jgi:hypothetical protein